MKRKFFQLIFLLLPAMGIGGSLHAQTGADYWTNQGNFVTKFADGNGSKDNPYLIDNGEQLAYLAFQINNAPVDDPNEFATAYYKLGADIDLKDHFWKAIGFVSGDPNKSQSFRGHFDGDKHTISNMFIGPIPVGSLSESRGFFGYITNGATIENIFLEGIVVSGSGNSDTGGLVGVATNSTITGCSVLGTISGVDYYAGGIVAKAGGCQISKCYSNVKFENVKQNVGGLAGQLAAANGNISTLSTSYSAGKVAGQSSVGGLVGTIEGGSSVTNCYSMATVAAAQDRLGNGGSSVGGIGGTMTTTSEISNCFARNPWIQGDISNGEVNVNRVVGISASSVYDKLDNNVALNMLVSRVGKIPTDTISDDPVGPNTPNGKTISDICEWDGGEGWVADTCTTPPYIDKLQSAPVTIVTSTTNEIIVKYQVRLGNSTDKELGTEYKIALLNSGGDTLEVVVNPKITSVPSGVDSTWIFIPITPFAFQLDSVFYAVAYEYGKMPSYPVQIIITPWDGNGKDKPYVIYTEPQLDAVRKFPDANYKLMNDLNMSGYVNSTGDPFVPIGTYTGTFDGNNHIIDSLTINNPTQDKQGLFGDLEGSVKSLGLENVYITGNNYVGALAGYGNTTKANIQNVYTTGTIIAQGDNVGGLAGQLAAKVSSCYSTCMVKGNSNVGGLIGYASGSVQSCYAAGPVFGKGNTGGFLGVSDANAKVQLSYSWGLVATSDNAPDGTFGGFIGSASLLSTMIGCFYNSNTSAQLNDVGNRSKNPDMDRSCDQIMNNLRTASDWVTDSNPVSTTYYYPQLKVFANDTAQNIRYCSALSVVPIFAKQEQMAGAVAKSFTAPLEYVIDNAREEIIPSGGSATCSIDSISKVISILPTGSADTLKITVKPFVLQPQSGPVVNIYERSRRMCFIPNQIPPVCAATRTVAPNANGWSKDSVVFTLQGVNSDGLIGGPVKFQHLISIKDDWDTLPGNRDVFKEEIKGLKVQYRAFNSAIAGDSISPKYNNIISNIVNIDRTKPVISNMTSKASDPANPVKGQATVSITFKDTLSGVETVHWEIGDTKFAEHDSIIHTDITDLQTMDFTLPNIAGSYPVSFTITDNAGNLINSKEAGDILTVYVEVPDGYVLDDVTVDGDTAHLEDPNNPLVWESKYCVIDETAEVILTPAAKFGVDPIVVTVDGLQFGDNTREFTVISKDGKVVQTFTVKICREIPVASFMTLKVNGETIPLKPKKFNYSLVKNLPNEQDSVIAEYTLANGDICAEAPSPYTFENLTEGYNTIQLHVTSAAKDSTNIYLVKIYREPKDTLPSPVDNIDITDGGLEYNPYDKDDNPNQENPFFDGPDENGNPIYGYNLRVQCKLATQAVLTVTPPAGTNATVIFSLMDDNNKVIPSTSNKTNSYAFKAANYYNLSATVQPEGEGIDSRTYHFYVVKRFEVDKGYFDKSVIYQRWDDVRAIINNPANNGPGNSDGGYTFNDNGYEWRTTDSNGKLMSELPNEKKGYISVVPGYYVALLTGEYKDSNDSIQISQVPTCPCEVSGVGTQAAILAYPSILKSGEKVTISTENISEENLKEGNVSIISSMGNMVGKKSLTGSNTEVTMPNAPGIYLLKVSTATVTKEFKIILK